MTRLSDSYRSGVTDALASVKLAVDFTSSNPLRWSSYTAPHADGVASSLSDLLSGTAAALKRVGPSLGYSALGAAGLYGLHQALQRALNGPTPYNDPVPQVPLGDYMQSRF